MEKWSRAIYQPCLPIGPNGTRVTASEEHLNVSKNAAKEGIVLLKNNNSLLPFKSGTTVAIFGKAQIDYVRGGGGSGDVVTIPSKNIYESLKEKSEVSVLDFVSEFYVKDVEEQYKNKMCKGMLTEPELPDRIVKKAASLTDTAIITINRYSGEGGDRKSEGDPYIQLSEQEEKMVEKVKKNFKHIVVLLNIGAVIETGWFSDDDRIEAAMIIWQGGSRGAEATAELLVGEDTPSGKLVDTFAKSINDYPSTKGFYESVYYVNYSEDIFVGYRYFETIPGMKEKVVYPFGYGLSYTTFDIKEKETKLEDGVIKCTVEVKNTGKYPGKQVVQLYYSAPEKKLTKAAIELAAFAKTKKLEPGKKQTLTLSFKVSDMASYDDIGAISKNAYVLEKGKYTLYIGDSVRSVKKLGYEYKVTKDIVVEQLESHCAPMDLDKRLLSDGTYVPAVNAPKYREDNPEKYDCPYNPPKTQNEYYGLIDVHKGKVTLDEFIQQLNNEQLIQLLSGQRRFGVSPTGGMGDVGRFDIPKVQTADGPQGVRVFDHCGVKTTAFPIATLLACTWNTEVVEEIGRTVALEMIENNIQIWLAPALNTHRSPLCGRNFEYYSEDPLISGKMAAAMVRGVQSRNMAATPKHFALNNKETNRTGSDSRVSERALREIYLKGFEICVKESSPKLIMTSYNLVNGIHSSENAGMIMGILRGEWGYKGAITTDWHTRCEHMWEIKAGNDIKMPYGQPEAVLKEVDYGRISRNEIAACAKRVLQLILSVD